MIRDSGSGEFQAVLCWDQDRLGRFDSMEAGHWIHPLRENGVHLVTVAQSRMEHRYRQALVEERTLHRRLYLGRSEYG